MSEAWSKIFTDGAWPAEIQGPGGWGAVLRYGGHEKLLCGGSDDTTNNRMELTAAIRSAGGVAPAMPREARQPTRPT